MKKTIILAILLACFHLSKAQLFETDRAILTQTISTPFRSGLYVVCESNELPASYCTYLFSIRNDNTSVNRQFQIASPIDEDDRAFFRKIYSNNLLSKNSPWHEFATRGINNFIGNQTIEGGVFTVKNKPIDDNTSSLSAMALVNRGKNGVDYMWKMYTAAVGGGSGVNPNAYEIWEYPNYGTIDNRQRFIILSSQDANYFNPLIVSNSGQALIGYKYPTSTSNDLSVNGNVGIGTTDSKGYKLAVNGTIRAQEVKIENTNWPDYVFSKNYQLPSLSEVSKHIEENNHLPGIPSAKEVEENGINLSEMNAKLLQKIEELTLYVIQQQKEIVELRNEVKEMKK